MVCAIANYILHQLDKDRKHMANLFRAVGVINEPLSQCCANRFQNIFGHIAAVAQNKRIL